VAFEQEVQRLGQQRRLRTILPYGQDRELLTDRRIEIGRDRYLALTAGRACDRCRNGSRLQFGRP
jgi:hypothetical protein